MQTTYFVINSHDISFEKIDDEVIAISLSSGSYYCMQGVASDIWGLFSQPVSIEQITLKLTCLYEGQEQDILHMVTDFVELLQKEGLIVQADSSLAMSHAATGQIEGNLQSEKRIFSKPTFQRFDDMRDMLILDPIHEVSELGWPHTETKQTLK